MKGQNRIRKDRRPMEERWESALDFFSRIVRLLRGLLSKMDSTGKPVWWVRLYHEGKERRFGSFTTKTAAREFYEKAKQEQKSGRFFPERYQHGGYELVQDTIDRYIKSTTTKKAKDDEAFFAKWWKATFDGKRLNAVTPAVLENLRQGLLSRGLTVQRVNRYLAWFRYVLNVAVRDGKLASNPASKLTMFKEPAGKTRYLSVEEEEKLLAAIGPTYAPWARLAILTGLRQQEQFSLRWKDVDLDRGLITLPITKAGGVQYVHLNEEARAILKGFDSWQRSVWVFPSENPASHMDARNFYARVWMPAVKEATIEWCTWHDLRHTFASRLAMGGHGDGTIAALLRHSTTALVKRYAHLSPSHLMSAVEGIASFGRTKTQASEGVSEPVHDSLISSPTVTETGTTSSVGERSGVEVAEKNGGPDTN